MMIAPEIKSRVDILDGAREELCCSEAGDLDG